MPTDELIEQRLSAVEAAVVELQRRVAAGPPTGNWVGRFAGSFEGEPAFAEVVEYGRALRSADRPHAGDG